MIRRDWVAAASVEDFQIFLQEKLKIFPELVEKRFNRNYGNYFVAYFLEEDKSVLNFGSFGLLKQIRNNGKILFEDDLDYLDENPGFMMEYLGFMHAQNKLDGKDKRINNRTFVEDYKIRNKNRVNLKEIEKEEER